MSAVSSRDLDRLFIAASSAPSLRQGFDHKLPLSLPRLCIGRSASSPYIDMAQRGHVPRFGDWNENAAYTICFDTARKGKVAGGNIVNPNDPEQSPELHKPAAMAAAEPQHPKQGRRDKAVDNIANQHHQGANYVREERREERQFQGYPQASPQPRGSGGQRTGARRNPGEAGYVRSPSPVTQGRAANSRQNVAGRQRPATVPKFGEWDAADPKSSAGYTVIFNQVKEEKKTAVAWVPAVPVQRAPSPATERAHHNDSYWIGLFPCLRPSVRY
ncbi:unnamed protein product [Musa acuminata var. zebrina]